MTNNKGVALITLVLAIVIFGTLALAVQKLVSQNAESGVVDTDMARALYLAEAGICDAFWEMKHSEKLYGGPTQPLGTISARTVAFESGIQGVYQAVGDSGLIIASGVINGISRRLMQRIDPQQDAGYAVFVGHGDGLSLKNSDEVTGRVFVNGDVVANNSANIDTNSVEFYLPYGCSASFSGGKLLPYTIVDPVPDPPSLDTSWFESFILQAASCAGGDESWGDREIEGTVLINGDLEITEGSEITNIDANSIIVVYGSVTVRGGSTIADSIAMIAKGDIELSSMSGHGHGHGNMHGITVGSTTGRSGNILFAKEGELILGKNSTVNGVLISCRDLVTGLDVNINGLVLTVGETSLKNGTVIRGAVWTGYFDNDSLDPDVKLYGDSELLPCPLPQGITNSWSAGAGEISMSGRWREIRE